MSKSGNLFLWSLKTLVGCLAFTVLSIGGFYYAIASDDHTWPNLSEDGCAQWIATCVWIVGAAAFAFVFLFIKELLKRQNFDLDTISDEAVPPEPWGIWLMKTIIVYIALIAILCGGTLLFLPVFHISWKDYLSSVGSVWIIGPSILAMLPLLVVFEAIRRWKLKHKQAKNKPSHLA